MSLLRFLPALLSTLVFLSGTGCGDGGHDHDHGGGPAPGGGGGHKHGSRQGGVAVELGEHQYQLDVLHDAAQGALNAWVMDGHMENFVRIAAPSFAMTVVAGGMTNRIVLEPVANPMTGETAGDTSEFRAVAPWLKGLAAFRATVDEIDVRGSRFSGVRFSYPEAGK